jgi:hypothetical protein
MYDDTDVPCAWRPASSERVNLKEVNLTEEESANDHLGGLSIRQTTILIVTSMVLCGIAALMEGGTSMIAAFFIHLAAHIAIVVGGRAEGIAVFTEQR